MVGRRPSAIMTNEPILRDIFMRADAMGLLQQQMATRIGCDADYLSKVRLGKRLPNSFFLTCMAESVGMKLVLEDMKCGKSSTS